MKVKLVFLTLLLFLTNYCKTTIQARDVETSGFLKDIYPKMWRGRDNEALLVYRNPAMLSFVRSSDKILLDPVVIWLGKESQAKDFSKKKLQHLADRFYSSIHRELSKDYEMVDKPQPDTIRIQIALTKVGESDAELEVVSKLIPQTKAFKVATEFATGKPPFEGEASIEIKVTKAETGKLIAAFVDRRVGGKKLNSELFDSWEDVYNIMDFWAKAMRFKFCRVRGDSGCVPPEE